MREGAVSEEGSYAIPVVSGEVCAPSTCIELLGWVGTVLDGEEVGRTLWRISARQAARAPLSSSLSSIHDLLKEAGLIAVVPGMMKVPLRWSRV